LTSSYPPIAGPIGPIIALASRACQSEVGFPSASAIPLPEALQSERKHVGDEIDDVTRAVL